MNETKPSVNLPFHPKNMKSYDGNKKSAFRVPTAGFDRITFDVEDPSCASKFKDHVDALAGHLGLTLKKGGPALAMAMRNGKRPVFTYPKALDPTEQQDQTKRFVFERDYARVDDDTRSFTENNNRAYELLTLHCSPATITHGAGTIRMGSVFWHSFSQSPLTRMHPRVIMGCMTWLGRTRRHT